MSSAFTAKRGLLAYCLFMAALISLGLLFSVRSYAATGVNSQINFQGRLLNNQGATVPDGYYNMEFKIYQDGDGQSAGDTTGSPAGSLKWTEDYLNANSQGVVVKNGFMSVQLGSINPFGNQINWNQSTLWLSVNIGGTGTSCTPFSSCSPDGEMVPMKRLSANPYALNSGLLGGLSASQFLQIGQGLQTDASTTSSLFLNKTATGNIIELQSNGTDVFTVGNAGDLMFGNNANHTLSVATSATSAGNSLTISAGGAGTGSGALTGGSLVLQGGSGGGTNGNGGNVTIDAGAKNGSGSGGTIAIGATNASAVSIGASSITTTIAGTTNVSLSGTTGTTQVCRNTGGALSGCDPSFLNPTSTNFILNQTGPQANSNFNISGSGTAATFNATSGINTSGVQRIDTNGNFYGAAGTFTGAVSSAGITNTSTYNGNTFTNSSLTFSGASTNTISGANGQNLTLQSSGSGALALTSGSGTVTANGNLSVGGNLSLGNSFITNLTRTLPTTVGNEVDLGYFALTNGGGAFKATVTVPSSGFIVSKVYEFGLQYNQTSNTWVIAQPLSDTGPYSAQDVALDVNVNNGTASFRLRRVSGTTAGTAYITLEHDGVAADTFTPSTNTSAVSTPVAYLGTSIISQSAGVFSVQGSVNVGTTNVLSSTGILQNAAISSSVNYNNLTQVGPLTSGSIASGFGVISTANNIATTATLSGGTISATSGYQLNGSIGVTQSTCTTGQVFSATTSGGIVTGGTCVAVATGTTGSYIQNGTSQQTANFNIVSSSSSSIAALIQAAAGATTPTLQVQLGATPSTGAGYLQLRDGSNTLAAQIDQYANFLTSGKIAAGSNSNSGAMVSAYDLTTSAISYIARGLSGKTGDFIDFQNSSGYNVAQVAADGTFGSGSSTTANTGGVNIKSGNATSGTNLNSGNVNIDVGTATGTTGSINIGSTNASAITLGNTAGSIAVNILSGTGGITVGNTTGTVAQTINIGTNATASSSTTINVGSTVAGSTTLQSAGGVTVTRGLTAGANAGGGTTFTNNGSTVNSVLVIANSTGTFGTGTAAGTVDIYTAFSINAGTTGLTYTPPTPTASGTYGRIIYVSNVGTNIFTLGAYTLGPGGTATLIWSNTSGGASWQFAGSDGSSILNQNSTTQSANFKINGTGVAGNFQVAAGGTFDTSASGALNIGTANASSIAIGKNGVTTTITGSLSQSTGTFGLTGNGNSNISTTSGSLTLTSAAAVTWGTSAGNLTLNSAGGTLGLSSSTSTIQRTAPGTTTLDLNDSGTTTLILKNSGSGVANLNLYGGSLTTGSTTPVTRIDNNGNFTAGSLTNNGSTVNSVLAISNSTGVFGTGTAAGTVDIYTAFSITAGATGLTYNPPTPTASTTYGRIIYVTNGGTNTFTLLSSPLRAGATATLIWANINGTGSWTFGGADNSSILNQTTQQTGANFNIDGTGTAGSLKIAAGTGLIDTSTAGQLNIGTTAATSILMGSNTTSGVTIQSSGNTQVQSTTDNSQAFTVTNSVGADIFTVDTTNTAATSAANLAVNGGAESGTTTPTSWAAVGSPSSFSRTTTTANVASGVAAVAVTTTATSGQGVKDNLGAALSNSGTQNYIVSFSIEAGGTPVTNSNLLVRYLRDGSTTDSTCVPGTNPTITTANYIKFSCVITPSTTAGNTSAAIAIVQNDAAVHTMYIDDLAVILQNNTGTQDSAVVRVGGATSQGLALFQLDTYAGTPFSGSNTALAGAMYFDTTQGKMQCFDGNVWGACGAAPTSLISLTPEYTGAVLHGTSSGSDNNIGTLTSDFCSNSLGINDGSNGQPTICVNNQTYNFYRWTSPQASSQSYSIYVTYQLPSSFKAFVASQTSLIGRTDSSNSSIAYTIYKNVGGVLSTCSASTTVSTGSQSNWQTVAPATDPATCGFAAGNSVVFKITVTSSSSANAYVSNLNFQYTNQ